MLAPARLDAEARQAFEAVAEVLRVRWPEVPITWNPRLRRAGRALLDTSVHGLRSAAIEISPRYFAVYPEDLRGILIHEAVHVGLALRGDRGLHGPRFRRVCLAAGGLLHSRWLPGRVYRYRCPICERVQDRRLLARRPLWCAACVETARISGVDPFQSARTLLLTGAVWAGPEVEPHGRLPVCDPAPQPAAGCGSL